MKMQTKVIVFSSVIAFTICDDKIHVVFTKTNEIIECEACHIPDSWNEIVLNNFDHQKTNYKLLGNHKNTKCKECHKGTSIDEIHTFTLAQQACRNCHKDIHKNQFKESYSCNKCHNNFQWSPSEYTSTDHNFTNFKLTGSHLAIACSKCHYKNHDNTVVYNINDSNCNSCHDDIHINQFDSNIYNCSDCHTTHNWNCNNFNHANTQFPLDGKHISVSCSKCHFMKKSNNIEYVLYKPIKHDCIDCHDLKNEG